LLQIRDLNLLFVAVSAILIDRRGELFTSIMSYMLVQVL
jgi:hypothetical protein